MPGKINKMPEIYMIFARKIFFPNFWGQVSPCPSPVSYAYGSLINTCQTHKLNNGRSYKKLKHLKHIVKQRMTNQNNAF